MSVIVYSKDNCGYCDKAKNLLLSKGQTYTEVKLGQDIIREDFMSLFPEVKTMPFIIIDGQHIGGYTDLVEWYKNNPQQFLAG